MPTEKLTIMWIIYELWWFLYGKREEEILLWSTQKPLYEYHKWPNIFFPWEVSYKFDRGDHFTQLVKRLCANIAWKLELITKVSFFVYYPINVQLYLTRTYMHWKLTIKHPQYYEHLNIYESCIIESICFASVHS